MKTAYLVKVKGRVTGVGFRYSAIDKSYELPSLQGYIRNAGYDEVEAFIQGEKDDVESMIAWLQKGPPCAKIHSVDINPAAYNPKYGDFGII